MKNKTKKRLAWILILVPAIYFLIWGGYNIYLDSNSSAGYFLIILSAIWLYGDHLLSEVKK